MEERSSKHRGAARGRRGTVAVVALLALIAVVAVSLNHSGPAGSQTNATAAPDPGNPPSPTGLRAALARDDDAIDEVLAYAPYIAQGRAASKEVALTFDDGPSAGTPKLLAFLKAHHVPATFFLVGKAIDQHTDIVREEARAGFSLGTHTESHAALASLTRSAQDREILTAADRITRISRHAVRLFRPPYGSFDAHTMSILHAERILMVLWSVDTKDYEATGPKSIVKAALDGASAGRILLFHDGPGPRPFTLAALRTIVPKLRARGYRLVSVPELLRKDPPPRHQPAPTNLAGG
ncbi:MAG TPA: polysaccharide deacetylase family protein [Solirubrobacteraceae bacterium]|jgi:peptidoglycan/xylan/chitin deacetylase (PgdA/CDA1 family)|nr:polysaccharide deacetylase family protein [Solirubrobacteraceae bacterium]